jgi:SPP1 family phage portal protein
MTEREKVADSCIPDGNCNIDFSRKLHGRRPIYTGETEITRDNVIDVLQKTLSIHQKNRAEIVFLQNYEKGIQPVINRTKVNNADINNKIIVNIASEITAFKEAEFAGEPIQYVSRRGNKDVRKKEEDENGELVKEITEKVASVNDMMISEGKQALDLEMAHDMFTCGVTYRLTYSNSDDPDWDEFLDEAPFEICKPDVENTYLVKFNDVKKRPAMGVTYVFKDPPRSEVEYTVYTKDVTYTITGTANGEGLEITDEKKHNFGLVTLVEYPCNPDRIGAFEYVLTLLDAINLTFSNQLDGVEQFIQALMVFDGVDISREQLLALKDLGAIQLPPTTNSNGGKKLYYLNEQLDQSQTNSLVSAMKQIVYEIVGMPSQGSANTGDSSNNGAVILRNGWWHAEARALQTQAMWKRAETEFLKIVLKMCRQNDMLEGLKISDLEPRFWRQSYEDLLVKNQSFQVLRAAGMPAIQAFKYSHLSKDPEADAIIYDEYQQRLAEELKEMNAQTEGLPFNENNTVNPASAEGIEAQAGSEEKSGTGSSEGRYGICPVCGKRFLKHEANQIYDSRSCANKARKDNGVGFRS